jgi:erythronate-4-phosphate dehydrogenase
MKIVIDHKIPYLKGALDRKADVVYLPGDKIGPEDVKDADALIIRTRTKCNEILLKNSSVRFIATATIGYDHIDTGWCEENGITWTNAPGCNSSSVEQYIVSALLYLAIIEGVELRNSTLGVIGVGNVGAKVARAANALGCKVLLNDPPRARKEGKTAFVSLDELLAVSDIVTLHVPLNDSGEDKTLKMADHSFFEKMKKDSVLINSSRGKVVDEKALADTIKSGKLAHAILDVFENEPKVSLDFLSLLTLATPHIAGYSSDGKANGTSMSVQALSRFFSLGMDDWKAVGVPAPNPSEILIDDPDGDETEIIAQAYAMTYNIQEDHDRLLDDIGKFENLRGSYRVRREPTAYSIRIFGDDGKYREIFEALNFSVIGDSCM